jgi:hypothetical protein
MKRFPVALAAFVLAILCSALVARAQSASGEIAGSVLDDSGAAIPKAAVTVLNTDTGLERRFETDSLGNYIFTQLSPGSYSLQVEKAGFQRFVREGITLQVGQRARIDVPLRVGAVTESVSINAQAGLLDVEEASLGQVIENRKILELPMNGRNLIGLAALTTGVSPGVGFGMGIPDGRQALVNAATASFLINGGMGAHNDVLMDGIPLAVCCQNQIALIPSIDTTQEFRVRTNLYDAQFGRTSGGLVTFASKAGTNAFHGSLYEFLRNRNLDANNFFNNRAGIAKAPFSYNQYGLRVGGPVIRNKTFFFFNYEAIRNRKGSFLSGNVPTAAERQGIFSVPVFDSASTRLQNGVYLRDPFPGNRIPAGRFDPVAVKLTDLWPLPNTTGANNFLSNASAGDNQDQYNVRIDHHFSPRHQIFGRVSISNTNGTLPDWFRTIGSPDTWEQFTNNRNAVLEDTLTLNPSTVMTFRYGFTRQTDLRKSISLGVDLTQFGWPASYSRLRQVQVLPRLDLAGILRLGATASFQNAPDAHTVAANVSKVMGRHFLKFGFEGRLYRANSSGNSSGAGAYTFSTAFTRGPDAQRGTGGHSYASFLLGYPATGELTAVAAFSTAARYAAVYAQDDIRLVRKLTINLGLRWDVDSPPSERYNRLSFFDPTAPSPLAGPTGLSNLLGGVRFPGVDGNPRSQQDTDWNNFGPRFGFAWNAKPRLVLRGGYGITYVPITSRGIPIQGFSSTTPFFSSVDGNTPVGVLRDPFPNGITFPNGAKGGLLTALGESFTLLTRKQAVGYNQEFSFNIQYELSKDLMIDAAYVGNRGSKLPMPLAINSLPTSLLSQGSALLTTVPNPFLGYIERGALSATTVTRLQLQRPFPQFLNLTQGTTDVGSSTYHSFQFKANKRFGQGFSILLAYTNSKLITDTGGFLTNFLETSPGYQDPYNRRLDRSLAPQDISQRLAISYIWELPFGKGKRYWSNPPRVLGLMAGGWQLNGITTFQTGQPVVIGNAVATTSGATRPNNIGQSAKRSGPVSDRLNRYFDTAVFREPGPFEYGSTPRTLPDVRVPGLRNFDVALFKNFGVTEKVKVQFRAEFFNFFNTPQFAPPGSNGRSSNFGNPDFGVISVQRNNPRDVQLALKLIF